MRRDIAIAPSSWAIGWLVDVIDDVAELFLRSLEARDDSITITALDIWVNTKKKMKRGSSVV